ncbi:MAG: ATP-binding cassette domain-containing protein, partial [Candidatus Thorarchaeota archaeon]
FVTLERFRESGKTIILITHKLREPMMLADRITVLRDGALVKTVQKKDTSPAELARMMVGRPVEFTVEKPPTTPGPVVLEVTGLGLEVEGRSVLKDINLSVRQGEILGIAGVEGNGQTELVETVAGLRRPTRGRVLVAGIDVTGKGVRQVRAAGLCHIPEDRQKRGLVLGFSVEENLILGSHRLPSTTTGPAHALLNHAAVRGISSELVQKFSIRLPTVTALAGTLSGGNQQKVVVARELSSGPKAVLAAQPTRGLDVGATEQIHRLLIEMRNAGAGILLVSAELDEVRSLSDRIAVMFNGRIVAFREPDTSPEELGLLMAGQSVDDRTEVESSV